MHIHVPVHGASRGPASTGAVERAVAEIAAAGAGPCRVGSHLVDILPVTHVQAVSTEVSEQRAALGAGGTLAKCLLATLVAGHAIYLVIDLQPE